MKEKGEKERERERGRREKRKRKELRKTMKIHTHIFATFHPQITQ